MHATALLKYEDGIIDTRRCCSAVWYFLILEIPENKNKKSSLNHPLNMSLWFSFRYSWYPKMPLQKLIVKLLLNIIWCMILCAWNCTIINEYHTHGVFLEIVHMFLNGPHKWPNCLHLDNKSLQGSGKKLCQFNLNLANIYLLIGFSTKNNQPLS